MRKDFVQLAEARLEKAKEELNVLYSKNEKQREDAQKKMDEANKKIEDYEKKLWEGCDAYFKYLADNFKWNDVSCYFHAGLIGLFSNQHKVIDDLLNEASMRLERTTKDLEKRVLDGLKSIYKRDGSIDLKVLREDIMKLPTTDKVEGEDKTGDPLSLIEAIARNIFTVKTWTEGGWGERKDVIKDLVVTTEIAGRIILAEWSHHESTRPDIDSLLKLEEYEWSFSPSS
jgi:hypothetical protein